MDYKDKTDQELKLDIQALESKAERIRSDAAKEGRTLTVVERSLLDDIKENVADLTAEYNSRPEGPPLTVPRDMAFGDAHGSTGGGTNRGPVHGGGRDYRSIFNIAPNARLDTGDFKDCAEFLRVMRSGRFDPRLEIRASMAESIPSSGGFSVPTQFAAEWLDASLPNEIVRNLCRTYAMDSNEKDIPGWDGSDMSGGATHGGLTMQFLAEGSSATAQTPKLRKLTLNAKLAGIYVDASLELVQDGRDFASNLEMALKKSLGYGIDRYCINGSGAGCPQGVLNAGCKIQIQKESGQNADTVVYANLKKMFARQLNPQNAVWLFNATSIPELLEQSVSVGTGGDFVPLLNEKDGRFTIFGRPVFFHPAMPTLGDEDDCAFVDFSFYALGLRKEMWLDMSDAPRWLQRERSFRILMRFDGMCTLDQEVTPEHGDTLSPIITLAERT